MTSLTFQTISTSACWHTQCSLTRRHDLRSTFCFHSVTNQATFIELSFFSGLMGEASSTRQQFKAPAAPLKAPINKCQCGVSRRAELPASSCCRRNILERLVSEPLVPGCCSLRVLMINWECYCPLGPSCPSSAVDPLWCLWATKLALFMC